MPASNPMERLRNIMATLRSEKGCPWDKEQTLETLKPYLVEETYEVLEAIDLNNAEKHCEELGDLLLQVVFQAQICEESGLFNFDEVAQSISDKLIRRHPHVFGNVQVEKSSEVVRNWDHIKRKERSAKGDIPSVLSGVPRHLPALLKAQEVQKRAARVGFDWDHTSGPQEKLDEELTELNQAMQTEDTSAISDEMGDVFFTLVNLCRHLGLNAEQVLQDATRKFIHRFSKVEKRLAEHGLTMENCDQALQDKYWETMKKEEA